MKKLLVVLLGVLLLLPFSASAADLKYGMKNNEEVRQVQQYLKDGGYYKGDVTGNFYSVTLAAVKKFQKENKLKVTGIWNQLSQDKKDELLAIHNDVYEQVAEVSNIPIGWIANGDGTFSPSPTVVNYPQAVASVWTPPEQIVYGTSPTYVPVINQPQTVLTAKSDETKSTQPPSTETTLPSNSTTATTIVPTTVALNSTVFNQSRTPYPRFYPFYYYINCNPASTDNRFNTSVFDSSLNASSIITSDTYRDLGYFTLNDQIIYNNDRDAWTKPGYFDLLAKAPKIKSITIKNDGTADLREINFSMDYDVPSAKKDPIRIVTFLRGERINLLPTTITKDTAIFNFSSPLPTNFNQMMTELYLLGDASKIKKSETIDFQVIGVELENNDPTINYSVKLPVVDGSGKVLKKCDLKS